MQDYEIPNKNPPAAALESTKTPVDPPIQLADQGGFDGKGGLGFGPAGMTGGPGSGFGGIYGMTGPGIGVTWMPNQNVRGQNADLGFVRQQTSIVVPLWIDGPDKVTFNTGIGTTWFNGNPIFPDSMRQFPNQIWNIHLGLGYSHMFDNGWLASFSTNLGSASDKPFATIHEVNFGFMGMLRVPSGENNAWIFSLMYNPTGELNIPIPGVAYQWVPSENFSMNIGLPFMMRWRPMDDWVVSFSYMPVRTIHSKLTWEFDKNWQAYIGWDWISEGAYLSDRIDNQERLLYYEKHVQAGLRFEASSHLFLDMYGGYAYDRFYFTGKSYSDRNHDQLDIGDGPYAGFKVTIRY
jgi:hypothetical protein